MRENIIQKELPASSTIAFNVAVIIFDKCEWEIKSFKVFYKFLVYCERGGKTELHRTTECCSPPNNTSKNFAVRVNVRLLFRLYL